MEKMAETDSGFAGVVGWHRSQISFRLQQLRQGGLRDSAVDDGVSRLEPVNKALRIADAKKLDGGGLLFHGQTENVEHWLLVDIRGRSLPIVEARIEFIINNICDEEHFVQDVYDKILERQADDVGLELYVSHLTSGALTRSSFLEVIASSDEAQGKNKPLLIIGYPYSASDNMPMSSTEESLMRALSITVTDI
jgi:hypothetical protein